MENKKVYEVLKEIGISSGRLGFKYLEDAITLTLEDERKYELTTKNLYPEIAKLEDTTPSRIDRAMRTAIMCCFTNNANANVIDEVFGNAYSSAKGYPTIKEFISSVAQYIKHMEE